LTKRDPSAYQPPRKIADPNARGEKARRKNA
jgi:hypothetical protein